MPDEQGNKEQPLSATEEAAAKAEAEAIARQQQPPPEKLNMEAPQPDAVQEAAPNQAREQQEQEWRERQEQEQREWEARQEAEGKEQPKSWLEAPQNEGINSHPPPDASPASPGKQQHQQAMAASTQGNGGKEIVTKTQLGVLVTLDGVYVVPKYTSVTRDKREEPSLRERFTKDQSSGRPQQKEQEKTKDKDRDKDRDRGVER